MSEVLLVSLVTSLAPLIVAVITLVKLVQSSREQSVVVKRAGTVIAAAAEKIDQIHEVTNTNFAVQRDEITALSLQIDMLKAALENAKRFQ